MKAVYSSKIRLLMQTGMFSHVQSPSPTFPYKSFSSSTRPFPSSSNISSSPVDSSKETIPLAPPLSKEKIAECFHCSISQNIHELSKKCSLIKTIQQQLNEKYNLFEIFHIPISYFIDEKALDMKYKQLQKNLHPDHYIGRGNSPEVVKNATDLSSAINYAFQTLKSPVLRAEYLYWLLFKKNVFEEGKTIKNPQLMMEMFEWREKISDATSAEDKKQLIQSIEDIIVDVQKSFEQSLQKRDAVTGMEYAIRLNYYHKMLEELDH